MGGYCKGPNLLAPLSPSAGHFLLLTCILLT